MKEERKKERKRRRKSGKSGFQPIMEQLLGKGLEHSEGTLGSNREEI